MMKKIITLIMCLICCCSYAFIIDGDGGSGWIAEPTSIIISGGGSSSGGWEEYDPAKTYYTVTLLDNDRTTILASKLVEEGSDVTIDFTPTKIGHVFTAWTDDNNVPVTQITNISADTRLFAMWDNGRYSITYYVDGEYQGIQFYDENDTITPLAAPAPYDAEVDSCFVGWYNIPQNFKMPAHDIIATATIDESYYINYNWMYQGGSTGYSGRQFTGLTPISVRNVKNNGYNIVKIPPVHNSYTVFAMYASIGNIFGGVNPAAIASFTSVGVEFPTEVYIGDNFTKKIELSGIGATLGVLSNVASVTIDFKGYDTYTDPYQGDYNNYNFIGSSFNNAKNLKHLDLSGCTNITQIGNYGYANLVLTSPTALETFIFPPNVDKLYLRSSFKSCVNPIIFPEVATLTMFCGDNPGNPAANYFLNSAPGPLHFVVASGTRFVFGNNHNHGIIDNSNNITFTFESSYLPQSDPDHPAIFARGSHIIIEYHSSRGEWQDPSFKENSTLWGTLSQYTWVDLDAGPTPIVPIITATYIDGLDASHTVSIATGTDNSINLGLDYVYEIKAKYTGANITALDTTTRWTSSDITVLSEELIDNETVCARIKLSDAYFANADQPHAQTLSFDNSGITSESPLATFSFSIIPQNFYSYDASGLGFAVAKYNNQTPMSMPVVANTLTLSSYQDRAYVVFTLDTRPDKSNSNLPTIVFGNPLVQSLEQLGHFAGTREEWEDIWSKFTLYWGNTAGATTKSYRANDLVVYRRIMGYENMECLPPMFNIDFEGIGAYSGYYTIFYTGSVLKKDVLKHLRTGNEYVLAYYNADTPISAQPAISIHLY